MSTRPRIIASIGEGSYRLPQLSQLLEAGVDGFRYNAASCVHPDQLLERIASARMAIRAARRPAEIMLDLPLPGRKRRLRTYHGREYDVPRGTRLQFVFSPELQVDERTIYLEPPGGDARRVLPEQVFVIGDGELAFRVTAVPDTERFEAESLTTWYLSDRKAYHLANSTDRGEPVEMLAQWLPVVGSARPDQLALSFVENGSELGAVRAVLRRALDGPAPRLIAKIESEAGVERVAEIAATADAIMIARGDLALSAPYELLGLYQKRIMAAARAAGCEVIVATHVLETTMTRHTPNRAEISDLTSSILEGAAAILLAKETSAPGDPAYAASVARRIIDAVWDRRSELAGPEVSRVDARAKGL
jgi:pyruvate kinase